MYNSTTAIINTTQASTTSSATTSNTTQTSITGSATTHTSTTAITSYGKNITSTSSHSYNTTIAGSTTTTTTAANVYSCPNEYYIGTYCNVSSDPCSMSEPCLNGATCFPNSTFPYGYFCQCVIGYSGENCEYNDGACMANTCW
jgi:hypothetical protein